MKGGLLGRAVTSVAGAAGVTLGENVFLSPTGARNFDAGNIEGVALVGHELTHVLQYRHLGGHRFLDAYLQNYAANRRAGQSDREAYRNIVVEHVAFQIRDVIRNFLSDNPDIATKLESGGTFSGSDLALISSALQEAIDEGELLEEGYQINTGPAPVVVEGADLVTPERRHAAELPGDGELKWRRFEPGSDGSIHLRWDFEEYTTDTLGDRPRIVLALRIGEEVRELAIEYERVK